MYKLNEKVSKIPKIGPKYEKLLLNLDIETVGDLIYHFPHRYDDFSKIVKIKDLHPLETVTVRAELISVKNIFTKNFKKLTEARVMDSTGELRIIWFNQHYLKQILVEGKVYSFSGKTGSFNNKVSLISPNFEEFNQNSLNSGRLVSVYPETAGITSKWLRARISDTLRKVGTIDEFLPEKIINKYDFLNINKALNAFHFPKTISDAQLARARFEFEELFLELLNVEARKSQWSIETAGIALKSFEKEVKEFINNLPFELTDSQKSAVDEIIIDLSKSSAMNRLLEGDVGTGKTVVAVIASYLAHLNGFQTLYMAPTEILANQHFETFNKFLTQYNIKIALQTSATKSKDDFNIIIGTHALLFKVMPENIGLVIIDEQHRFGVEQRAQLLNLRNDQKTPHLLTMTATPIPRTLALTIYGDLAISALKTHPNKEKKISTRVIPDRLREDAYKWIKEKGEPTFIVCPLIDESEMLSMENVRAAQKEYDILRNGIFSHTSIGLLHGRMKSADKQAIVEKFRNGEINVLVSTPVIEVGIDIPDATVIVIESAERYGLASLHQLRGRVGRGKKEGFCFIFMSNNSRTAYQRLKYLEKLNSGLDLAEVDLKLRGAGDIYGTEQSGFKKFKVANLQNFELVEKAKKEAQFIFTELENYPKLRERLKLDKKKVKNN